MQLGWGKCSKNEYPGMRTPVLYRYHLDVFSHPHLYPRSFRCDHGSSTSAPVTGFRNWQERPGQVSRSTESKLVTALGICDYQPAGPPASLRHLSAASCPLFSWRSPALACTIPCQEHQANMERGARFWLLIFGICIAFFAACLEAVRMLVLLIMTFAQAPDTL